MLIKQVLFAANGQTSVLFLIGMDPSMNEDQRMRLLEEQKNKDDIIEVEGLIEHYDNLTLKTMYTIKFFLKSGNCNLNILIRAHLKSKYSILNNNLNDNLLYFRFIHNNYTKVFDEG